MLFKALVSSAVLLAGNAAATMDYGYGSGSGMSAQSSAAGYGGGQAQAATTAPAPAMTSGSSSSSSGGEQVAVHVIKVSNKNGSLTYSPNSINAPVGAMIQFQFYPKNHSVVQSTFDKPCEPLANNQPGSVGIFSGFMPVAADATMMPTYTIVINDTKPIWYYCSQAKHCQSGMVGVINPPAANTSRNIDSYKALAAKAPNNLSPGQDSGSSSGGSVPAGTGSVGGSGAATTTTSGPQAATGVNAAGRATVQTQLVGFAVLFGMGVALLL